MKRPRPGDTLEQSSSSSAGSLQGYRAGRWWPAVCSKRRYWRECCSDPTRCGTSGPYGFCVLGMSLNIVQFPNEKLDRLARLIFTVSSSAGGGNGENELRTSPKSRQSLCTCTILILSKQSFGAFPPKGNIDSVSFGWRIPQ